MVYTFEAALYVGLIIFFNRKTEIMFHTSTAKTTKKIRKPPKFLIGKG